MNAILHGAWSQHLDSARGLVATLEPRILLAVVLVLAVSLALLRRRRTAPVEAAEPRPGESPAPAAGPQPPAPTTPEHGPPYTVHFNHEVRTPITAILGYTEMLSAPDASPAERVEFLECLHRNCLALARLADETLAFARTESGDLTTIPETMDLAELLDEPLFVVRPDAAARRLAIAISGAGRLPARIRTDAFCSRQVLVHLLRTAIHLTPTGQVRVVVRWAEPAGDAPARLEVDVHDGNAAIGADVRTALFDPWHDSTLHHLDVVAGAGLRLAIAKRLAEKLGGTVTAGPPTPAGGSYRFVLPTEAEPEVPWIEGSQIFARPRVARHVDQPYLLQGRVLVVESASEIGWMLRTVVAGRGVEVETCATSADAWDRLAGPADAARPWSALVVDVEDPEVDGSLLVQRLRLDHVAIPIVAVGGEQTLPPACTDGVIILAKPTRVLKLYDAVRPYLRSAA